MSLSRRTVTRRIEDMSADVKGSFTDFCARLLYFSIALDESADLKDFAQLAVFAPNVMSSLEIVKYQLISMHDTTTGKDVF